MCGIAGVIDNGNNSRNTYELLKKMSDVIVSNDIKQIHRHKWNHQELDNQTLSPFGGVCAKTMISFKKIREFPLRQAQCFAHSQASFEAIS